MNAIFRGKIFTIPNLLSFLRLVMILWFVWEYLDQENSIGTALILLLSGFTDTIDGWIARRFNMVSNLGKALDPVADKLTQIAMIACLVIRFPHMWVVLGVLVVKEFTHVVPLSLRSGSIGYSEAHTGRLTAKSGKCTSRSTHPKPFRA